MTPQERDTFPRWGRVRRPIWVVLFGALLVSMALPLSALLHAALSPLQAEVCLWPPTPQAQEQVQVIVTLPDAADQSAVAGSWAHLQVTWDMTTMPMGTHPITLKGNRNQAGVFSVPLRMDMVGPWWVALTLQTPGRPDWHSHFQVIISPSGVTSATFQPQLTAAQTPALCHARGESSNL